MSLDTTISYYKVYDGSKWVVLSFKTVGEAVQVTDKYQVESHTPTNLQTYLDKITTALSSIRMNNISIAAGYSPLTNNHILVGAGADPNNPGGSLIKQAPVEINQSNPLADLEGRIPSESVVKKYVDGKITEIIGGAPEAYNTLKELLDLIGEDGNNSTPVTGMLADIASNKTSITNINNQISRLLDSDTATDSNTDAVYKARKATYADSARDATQAFKMISNFFEEGTLATKYTLYFDEFETDELKALKLQVYGVGQTLDYSVCLENHTHEYHRRIFQGSALPTGVTARSGDIWLSYS